MIARGEHGNAMINKPKYKLTLDRTAIYQIKVSGVLDESWSEWADMTITAQSDDDGAPITTLAGIFDQAALQGLLRRLYSKGFPLISLIFIGDS